ncbi:MAG: YHYH protein [Armatimonadetes bacterium]|nr:YHYH protein [Armatimonadota bacterium]
MKPRLWLFSALGLAAVPVIAIAAHRQTVTSSSTVEAIAASFKPFAPKVKTRADAKNFYVESDGMPDHPLMVGITAWQQQVPIPQRYVGSNAWQFPLRPVPAANPLSGKTHFFRGAMALAADGVPIFNALNNRGVDSFKIGELDEFGGHCGRADDYHYHIAPLYLEKLVGKGKPIAYALDGYAIYGQSEPDGKPVTGLDAFNGHTTSAIGYHYHGTKTYPYLNGGFHGEVQEIGGQVDPQPRAQSPRPDTPPLPGAKITAFSRPTPGSYSLTYVIQGQTCLVNYKVEDNGSYTFDYVNPEGRAITLNYPQRGQGGGQGRQQNQGRGRPQERPGPTITPAKPTDFQLISSVVENGGLLPKAFTCDGESASPPVAWKNAPAGTKSFALVMHHYPPGETEAPHVYWLAYNISPDIKAIPQNDRAIGARGVNTVNRRSQYAPPCSQGPGKKWYILTLYALSDQVKLDASSGVTRDALLKAMEGKILSASVLNVAYERQRSE